MTVDLAVTGGTLVTPEAMVEGTLLVDGEGIEGIVSPGSPVDAASVVDVDGSLVMPGVVDPHVHVGGPFTIDTYESGSEAAALGGITSFVSFAWQAWDGPDTPWDESGTLTEAVDRKFEAAESSIIDFAVHATITDEDLAVLAELPDLVDRGVVSYKMFTAYDFGLANGFIERVFEELASLDAVAVLHTEDNAVCTAREAAMRESGRGAPEHYPDSRPPHAEAMAADDAVRMAQETGVKYYGIHTTSRDAAEVIDTAQTDKSQIRGETCVHYTTLDRSIYERMGALPMLAPPLRTPDHNDAMFEHLETGTLDVVSTDHVAFAREDKDVECWWDSEYGANSLQRSLPVFHDEAVVERGLSYPKLVRLMCANPARLFGLQGKGTLQPGTDADFVVFDPTATQTITAEDNASRADYSIYEGREVTGRVERTYRRGECIAADGAVLGTPGDGQRISRSTSEW